MKDQRKNENDIFDKVDAAVDETLTDWGELSRIMEDLAVQRFQCETLPEMQKEFWAVVDIQEWLEQQRGVPNLLNIPSEICERIRLLRGRLIETTGNRTRILFRKALSYVRQLQFNFLAIDPDALPSFAGTTRKPEPELKSIEGIAYPLQVLEAKLQGGETSLLVGLKNTCVKVLVKTFDGKVFEETIHPGDFTPFRNVSMDEIDTIELLSTQEESSDGSTRTDSGDPED